MKPLRKMIITDDEEDILTIAQFSLEDLKDIQIRYCHSGQETIQEALNFQPDLIILDVMMPNMDGLATLQALKKFPSLTSIPVIFLTAKSRKEEIEVFKKLGAIGTIAKPFDPLTLPQIILDLWKAV